MLDPGRFGVTGKPEHRGGNANPGLDPEIRPLHLSAEEKRDLVAFLRALSGAISEGVAARPAK